MKNISFYLAIALCISCSDSNQQKVDQAIDKTSDSLRSKLDKLNDTLKGATDKIASKIPKVDVSIKKHIPISLQWIGFNTPGDAALTKLDDGSFAIKGEQTNKDNEYLKIDGKIKRVDANRIQFDGTIITYVKMNNGGKPCEKTGVQTFLKKDGRTYYRLQNMTNCEGGRLVDYVDLYDLDDVLN
jgi:hypothetical protein